MVKVSNKDLIFAVYEDGKKTEYYQLPNGNVLETITAPNYSSEHEIEKKELQLFYDMYKYDFLREDKIEFGPAFEKLYEETPKRKKKKEKNSVEFIDVATALIDYKNGELSKEQFLETFKRALKQIALDLTVLVAPPKERVHVSKMKRSLKKDSATVLIKAVTDNQFSTVLQIDLLGRTMESRCSCGYKQPCVHARAVLHKLTK